jgi:hypothetical protein
MKPASTNAPTARNSVTIWCNSADPNVGDAATATMPTAVMASQTIKPSSDTVPKCTTPSSGASTMMMAISKSTGVGSNSTNELVAIAIQTRISVSRPGRTRTFAVPSPMAMSVGVIRTSGCGRVMLATSFTAALSSICTHLFRRLGRAPLRDPTSLGNPPIFLRQYAFFVIISDSGVMATMARSNDTDQRSM